MANYDNFVNIVSFDDLAPSFVNDQVDQLKKTNIFTEYNNGFLHIPPQFNPLYNGYDERDENTDNEKQNYFQRRQAISNTVVDQETQTNQTFYKMFTPIYSQQPPPSAYSGSRSFDATRERSSSPYLPLRRGSSSRKLPPPPDIGSIRYRDKNIDEPAPETEHIDIADMDFDEEKTLHKITDKNTEKNSGSKGYTQSAFSNLNELEDRLDTVGKVPKLLPKKKEITQKGPSSKKSFANMTDEELTELENKYKMVARSNTRSTINDFDFKQQDSLFIGKLPSKNSSSGTKVDPLAAIYPSRPVINYRAISITRKNKLYDDFISNFSEEPRKEDIQKIRRDKTALRTILCYISGRKYTWSGVDWFIQNQVRAGDHIVIIACIPEYENEIVLRSNEKVSKGSKTKDNSKRDNELTNSFGPTDSKEEDTGSLGISKKRSKNKEEEFLNYSSRLRTVHEKAISKANKIMNYYSSKLSGIPIKITVEIIKSRSRKVAINQAIKVYNPDWQIVSTVSIKLQIKFRNGNIKLPYFMMKDLFTPTCIVPYEFMDPKLIDQLDEGNNQPVSRVSTPKISNKMEKLDDIFQKTVKNPFLPISDSGRDDDVISHNSMVDDDSIAETVGSINEFRPIGADQQQKIDLFERIGYVRPTPTRQEQPDIDEMRLTPSRSSGRSSRIQFTDEIYHVKSMIDDVMSGVSSKDDHIQIRKTKSHKSQRSQKSQQSKSDRLSENGINHRHHRNYSTSPRNITPISTSTSTSSRSKKTKKTNSDKSTSSSKKGIRSLFKKFF